MPLKITMRDTKGTTVGFGRSDHANHCDFCDEFAGGTNNGFSSRYNHDRASRALFASEHFRVFPSIGQLLEGYLLIAPIAHYAAADEMPLKLISEMNEICKVVRTILSREHGPCIFFEHGAREQVNGGCGIYHSHIHAIPLGGVLDPVTSLKQMFRYTEFADYTETCRQSATLPCYLYYQDKDEKNYLFETGPLPSQYMRKLIANEIGTQNWNWRTAGKEDRLLRTIDRLSQKFVVAVRE